MLFNLLYKLMTHNNKKFSHGILLRYDHFVNKMRFTDCFAISKESLCERRPATRIRREFGSLRHTRSFDCRYFCNVSHLCFLKHIIAGSTLSQETRSLFKIIEIMTTLSLTNVLS